MTKGSNVTRLKALAVAVAAVTPIVAAVSVVSAGTASASCRSNPIEGGVYRSSNDDLSRVDLSYAQTGCTLLVEAYATCDDDPTSDCSWGTQEKFHSVRDNPGILGYAYHEWNNAYESVSILSAGPDAITVTSYTAWDDGTTRLFDLTLTKDE